MTVAKPANGWPGEGLKVLTQTEISLPTPAHAPQTRVSIALGDIWEAWARLPVYCAFLLPQRLDERRLIEAAQQLLKSFPVLGARLDLPSFPDIFDVTHPAFPLTFAEWPGAPADPLHAFEWEGQAAGQWLPVSPLFEPVQVDDACAGKDALFKLRVTAHGSGCILGMSWLHILGDGQRLLHCLGHLATAYRDGAKAVLLPARLQRGGWLPQAVEAIEAAGKPVPEALRATAMPEFVRARFLDALTEAGHYKSVGVFVVDSEPAKPPEVDALLTLRLAQEDLDALHAQICQQAAVKELPGGHISQNDVVLAVAWLLSCDAQQKPRPGQGPSGSVSVATQVFDFALNDRDGLLQPHMLPAGSLCNYLNQAASTVESAGGKPGTDPAAPAALYESLAAAAAACRRSILSFRADVVGQLAGLAQLVFQDVVLAAELAKAPPDLMLTSWASLQGLQHVNFGEGPPAGLTGHFGVQRFREWVPVPLPGAVGLRIALGPAQKCALRSSPVLRLLPSTRLS